MDLEKLQKSYQNISRDELQQMWRFGYFERSMETLNGKREKMKIRGREHVVSVPLVQVLSVHVIQDKVDVNKPLAIYGRIYGEYDHMNSQIERVTHNVYNRGCNEPETISQNGNLTLADPDRALPRKFDECMPLHKTTIVVDLWDADQKVVFSQGSFLAEEIAGNEYEQVKLKVVPSTSGYVVVRYIAMPFATLCDVSINFFHEGFKREGNRDVVNVNGKIAIRYDNTYGNYSSEEYTIFEKPNFEFEPVEVDKKGLRLSRYWITVPAYCSLVIDWDIWDFDTKRNILKETVKFPTQRWFCGYQQILPVDDLAIYVNVWSRHIFSRELWIVENNHESAVMVDADIYAPFQYSDDESSSDISSPGTPCSDEMELRGTTLVEFFSIFIGHEKKHKPLQIFGVIEASCGGQTFDIFRRQENNALELMDETTLPILDGNRDYDSFHSLKIMFDLKDVDGHVFIKGFVKWSKDELDFLCCNEQLCSVIPGEHGFAALHYTLFGSAVQANIEVFYRTSKSCCSGSPIIYGSLVAQYNGCDYSSLNRRDYYRTVLFKRKHEDALQVPSDMKFPLDRSVVVVPKGYTLVIEVDLWTVGLDKCLSHVFEIEIGCRSMSIDGDGFSVDISLKWSGGLYMYNSNNQ